MSEPDTRQQRRQERRQAILDGAARAFSDSGYAGTSIESIASVAGVSKLVIYRYFDSKDELYRTVLKHVAERLIEEFTAAIERGENDRAVARHLVVVGRENPDGVRLLWRHAAREPDFAAYPESFRTEAARLARLEMADVISDPVLLGWAAETIVSVLVEAVLGWLEHGDRSRDDEFVERLTISARRFLEVWGADLDRLRAVPSRPLVVADEYTDEAQQQAASGSAAPRSSVKRRQRGSPG